MLAGGYDIQGVHQLEGARALKIAGDVHDFVNLLVEFEPPFACSLVGMGPEREALAQRKVRHAVKLWDACLEAGNWPSYNPGIHYADAQAWEEAGQMSRESAWGGTEQEFRAKIQKNEEFMQSMLEGSGK